MGHSLNSWNPPQLVTPVIVPYRIHRYCPLQGIQTRARKRVYEGRSMLFCPPRLGRFQGSFQDFGGGFRGLLGLGVDGLRGFRGYPEP